MFKTPGLIEKIKALPDPEIVADYKLDGKGTAAVEAPRGILYHTYEIKDSKIEQQMKNVKKFLTSLFIFYPPP